MFLWIDTVNFEEIGLATSDAVGSDLANMINEALSQQLRQEESMYHRMIFLKL